MELDAGDPVGYGNPPVIEAVLGIEFAPSAGSGLLMLSALHDAWMAEYPNAMEQPPLPPTRPVQQGQSFTIEFAQGQPQVRLWMASADNSYLVQTQNDRLLLNWRKVSDQISYPGFEPILSRYTELMDRFLEKVSVDGSANPALVTEWSYINVVQSADLVGLRAFEVWSDPVVADQSSPILTRLQHIRSFTFESGQGQLDISVEPHAMPSDTPSSLLSISAKCFHKPGTTVREAVGSTQIAHSMARHAFDGVVTDDAKQRWGAYR